MAYNSAYTGSQVDAAVGAVRQKETIWDGKQDELTGTEDQLVGFNSAGEATAVSKPTAADIGAMPAVSGGTAGQVLTKTEAGQEWQDAPDGLPEGGTEGQVLTKTPTGAQWDDVPSDIPAGGTQGQVLTKGDGETVTWSDPASGLPTGGTPGQMLYQGESGPKWGDKPVFWVTISTNDNGETFTADHTAKEVYEAYQSGNVVFAKSWGQDLSVMNLLFSVKNDMDSSDVYQCYFMTVTISSVVYASIVTYPPSMSQNDTVLAGVDYIQADYISFSAKTTGLTSDNVQDAIEEVNDKVVESTSTTVTLTAAGWTGSAAPYSQQVSCSIVAADTAVVAVDVDTPGTDADADAEAINAWALCTQRNPTQGAGTLTFYCTEKPTINIPVKVGVA